LGSRVGGRQARADPDALTAAATLPPRPGAAVFTVLNLPVADVDAAVEELARKGISMERDDFDGMEPE
jgi:hypothetical protein